MSTLLWALGAAPAPDIFLAGQGTASCVTRSWISANCRAIPLLRLPSTFPVQASAQASAQASVYTAVRPVFRTVSSPAPHTLPDRKSLLETLAPPGSSRGYLRPLTSGPSQSPRNILATPCPEASILKNSLTRGEASFLFGVEVLIGGHDDGDDGDLRGGKQ